MALIWTTLKNLLDMVHHMEQAEPREPPETFDEDFEAAEIERVFGPVDEKQQDVEQV